MYRSALALLLLLGLVGPLPAVELVDQNGRQVTVPDHVKHVVAIPIPLASMVMAVDGSAQRLIGMHAASQADFQYGLLERLYPQAATTPTGMNGEGFMPNVEALAASGADVVLQWGDRGDGIVSPISAVGLPVVTLRYGDSRLAADWLRLVGVILGKAERGEQLAAWFESGRQAIAERSSETAAADRPRVVYLYRARSGLQVAGKGTSMDSDIRLAGGKNVAADVPGFAPVDIEQLLTWDPQVVLLNNFEPGLTPDELYQDKRLAELSAFREQRIYSYPHGGFRWDPPSQETPLSLDWLFNVLHPQQAVPNLRQRIADGYRLLYGYQVTATDLDDLLKLSSNGGSAHYRELFAGDSP